MRTAANWAFINLLTLLFVQSAVANYLDYSFLDEPEVSVRRDDGLSVSLKSVCDEMKYNYLEETKKFYELKAQLEWAVQQPLTGPQSALIGNLKKELRKTTERLVFLSKPEWNSEILFYSILWRFPSKYYERDIDIKSTEVMALYYKGELANHLIPQLITYALYFGFQSRGTYLEVCQFVPAMEVELKLSYISYSAFFPRLGDVLSDVIKRGEPTSWSQALAASGYKYPISEEMFFLKGRNP